MGKYEIRVYYGRVHTEEIEADSLHEALEIARGLAYDNCCHIDEEEIDDLEVIDLSQE